MLMNWHLSTVRYTEVKTLVRKMMWNFDKDNQGPNKFIWFASTKEILFEIGIIYNFLLKTEFKISIN